MDKPAAVDHGEQNAAGWVQSISEMVAALECDYDRLEELRDERDGFKPDLEMPRESVNTACREYEWAQAYPDEAAELAELEAACTIDGDKMGSADDARERIQESPLSVEVRSDWRNPGDDHGDPSEFKILLSTGGPALRIMGELDEHNQPSRAWLEYQDWGTAWTQYFKAEQSTLLAFASCFYFGE